MNGHNVLKERVDDGQKADRIAKIVAELKLSPKFVNQKCQPFHVGHLMNGRDANGRDALDNV